MIPLDYRDTKPIYAQIIDSLVSQIRAGILQEGDKLPSVRELASQLAINPNTIQRAYRELESAGWVASVPGKGSFVCHRKDEKELQIHDLLNNFDSAVRSLNALGVSNMDLIARLTQMRGDDNA